METLWQKQPGGPDDKRSGKGAGKKSVKESGKGSGKESGKGSGKESGKGSGKESSKKSGDPGTPARSDDRTWFYRFTTEEDRELDRRLIPCDILVNIAQARMLKKIGIYDDEGYVNVSGALQEAWKLYTDEKFDLGQDDEDVHSAIEKFLTERAGQEGARIHTGRSRNDQVLADMRLFMKEAILEIAGEWIAVARRIEKLASDYNGILFAGLTHTQPAMPHSVDAWATGYMDLLVSDLHVLREAYRVTDQSPLGSAAGFGVPHIPIDREFLADELGFARIQVPVAASQLSRGRIEMQLIDALSYGALTFNRMASDVVLFMHPSWSLVTLSEDQVSGSSIMPQKRNPDAWELIRGAYHELVSARAHLSGVPANLTSGYHRDLQVVKKSVMAALEQSKMLAGAVRNALEGLEFNEDAAARTLSPELFATHRANKLVSEGMPFREAYREIARETPGEGYDRTGAESGAGEQERDRDVSGTGEKEPDRDVSGNERRSKALSADSYLQGEIKEIYRHTGAPGSGVPDILENELKTVVKWQNGQLRHLDRVKKHLLSEK